MNPVGKAIWYIESHFADNLTLQTIAEMSHVSQHHLVRAFGTATGYSVMRYVRARRLSVAAAALANGAPNILDVAIEAGYNSHEAFTRAFCNQFGITPEGVRKQCHINNIEIVEPIIMSDDQFVELKAPQLKVSKAMTIAGISERYGEDASANIPSQWQRFNSYFGSMSGQVDNRGYGVVYNGDDDGKYDYMAGVEVSSVSNLPDGFDDVKIPARQHLVFVHSGHISGIVRTWITIWGKSLPDSDYVPTDDPTFEVYGNSFDPETGMGEVEIWIPVDKKS